MYNLDPDNHLSSCITLSDYFTEDEVNGKTSVSLHNPSYFSVLHLNARSLSKNIDNLKLLLGSLQKSFYAICVSETWLTDLSSDEVEIPGYKFISSHRVISLAEERVSIYKSILKTRYAQIVITPIQVLLNLCSLKSMVVETIQNTLYSYSVILRYHSVILRYDSVILPYDSLILR